MLLITVLLIIVLLITVLLITVLLITVLLITVLLIAVCAINNTVVLKITFCSRTLNIEKWFGGNLEVAVLNMNSKLSRDGWFNLKIAIQSTNVAWFEFNPAHAFRFGRRAPVYHQKIRSRPLVFKGRCAIMCTNTSHL